VWQSCGSRVAIVWQSCGNRQACGGRRQGSNLSVLYLDTTSFENSSGSGNLVRKPCAAGPNAWPPNPRLRQRRRSANAPAQQTTSSTTRLSLNQTELGCCLIFARVCKRKERFHNNVLPFLRSLRVALTRQCSQNHAAALGVSLKRLSVTAGCNRLRRRPAIAGESHAEPFYV